MSKRFSYDVDLEPIELVYNGDVFLVSAEAPADTIADLAKLMESQTDAEKVQGLKSFMLQVLLPEYKQPYMERLRNPEKPIGFKQLLKTFEDLVEAYTEDLGGEARPTEAASSSPSGAAATGGSSTPDSPSSVEVIQGL